MLPGSTKRIIKTKRSAPKRVWTAETEAAYKKVVSQIQELGYSVRREELKRGHGWRVVSGSCRSSSEHLVFVDSRLAPREQVSFLSGKLLELQVAQVAA